MRDGSRAVRLFPFLANAFGWIFTEMGRQPWSVFGLLQTSASVSPGVSTGEVVASLTAFTLVYGALLVVEVMLLVRYAKAGPAPLPTADEHGDDGDSEQRPLAFASTPTRSSRRTSGWHAGRPTTRGPRTACCVRRSTPSA